MWPQLNPASVPSVPNPLSSGEEEEAFSVVQAHEQSSAPLDPVVRRHGPRPEVNADDKGGAV